MIGVLAEYLVSGTTRNKHERCAESGRLTEVSIAATMYPKYGSGSPSAHSILKISSRDPSVQAPSSLGTGMLYVLCYMKSMSL